MSRRKKNDRVVDPSTALRVNLSTPKTLESQIEGISKTLTRQVDKKIIEERYAHVRDVLILVGAGAFLAAAVVMPGLPILLKPFLKDNEKYEVWKRFNIPYLKRTLKRLQREKLVEFEERDGKQVVKITEGGNRKILRYVLEEIEIEKPKVWDRKWRLISYDIPSNNKYLRRIFKNYLSYWGFYPLHESVFLHAYHCEKEVEFLREYLGIGEFVRIFVVTSIENDSEFRKFFGI